MKWTADKVAALKALFIAGQTKEALAEYCNVTPKAIESKLKRMGLTRKEFFPKPDVIDWFDKKNLDVLKAGWAAGRHASDIADELGCTKGAVIGKAHRLGLSPPTTRRPPATPRVRARPGPGLPFVARRQAPPPVDEGPVRFIDLEKHHCRWVIGEPAELIMCGVQRHAGSPYCPAHDRIAFNPAYRKSA